MEDLKVPLSQIKMKNATFKTTYDPYNVCKKELLLLQERFGGKLEVFRPFYLDEDGIRQVVIDNTTFNKI